MQVMRKFLAVAATVFAMGFMTMAQAQSADQILANPKVDDIYAARVDLFSEATFGEGGRAASAAYGLMRVVRVTGSDVIVVTEDAAWPEKDGCLGDLRGDFSDISWDMEEEITVKRSELASLKTKGQIVDARRLTAQQIRDYLN